MSARAPSHRLARLGTLALAAAIAVPAVSPAPVAAIPLPVALPDAFSFAENGSITVTSAMLLANDFYGIGTTVFGQNGPGGWAMSNGGFTYTPPPGFSGVVTAQYIASNGAGGSAPAPITITVTGPNAAPTIATNGQDVAVRKGDTVDLTTASDLDLHDAEAWNNDLRLTIDPAKGTVSIPLFPAGIAFLEGDGDTDGKLVMEGTLSQLEDAIELLWYHAPAGELADATQVLVKLEDLGCCGTGGAKSAYGAIAVTLLRDEMTAPALTKPKTSLRTGAKLDDDVLPIKVAWSQTDASPIHATRLEREEDGAADWIGFTAPKTQGATSVTNGAWAKHTFRFRVRSTDRWGNQSSWVYGPTIAARLAQQSSSAITYRGTWKTSTSGVYSGGSATYAKAAGASATFSFTGRSVAWVSRMAYNRGRAKVYVDGTYVKTVDLYRSSTAGQRLVFAKTWSSVGKHTLKIVVLGTAGRPRVDLDGFAVLK